jgi:predicted MFS family arabinose efflux permease
MTRPQPIVRVFLPFAFGFWLSYLFRTVNAVIAPQLIADFAIDARRLGLLTGVYFLAFASAQIPLGVILDRVGARRTEAVLLVLAALGAAAFGAATSFAGLFAGRALIGIGVSACLMAAFRAFVTWFPPQRLPFVNGCLMAAGGLGAITATKPVAAALTVTDWRGLFFALAGLAALAAAVISLVVPGEPKPPAGRETWRASFAGIGRVFASALFWRIVPLTVPAQATFLAVQGLWVGPWLADVGGLGRQAVADQLFAVAAAMICGYVGIGRLAERLSRRGIAPIRVALAGVGLFILTEAAIVLRVVDPVPWLWIAYGFFGTVTILPYAILSQGFPPLLAGRVNAALNVLVFVAAFSLQWGIGAIIRTVPAPAGGGFAPAGYDAAFTAALALQIAGLLWYALFRRRRVAAG